MIQTLRAHRVYCKNAKTIYLFITVNLMMTLVIYICIYYVISNGRNSTRGCWWVLCPTYFPMSLDGIDSVVGKRGLFMCRIASLFLLQRLKGSMSRDAHNFNNIETPSIIKSFFYAWQGAEGNARHSERNIRGTCTIVCHRQKLGRPV